ncbi:MAG: hypothetical protein Q7R63_01740 [bacterium]|nr:hypothetical protein [bacterium]
MLLASRLDSFFHSQWIPLMAGGFAAMLFMGFYLSVVWLVHRWFWPPPVLLYFSKVNGVIAIVRAWDYDKAVEDFWWGVKAGKERHPGPDGVPRIHVKPVVLFVGPSAHHQFNPGASLLGNEGQYALATEGARLEERKFFVPMSLDGFDLKDIKPFQWLYHEVQGRTYHEPPVLPEKMFASE